MASVRVEFPVQAETAQILGGLGQFKVNTLPGPKFVILDRYDHPLCSGFITKMDAMAVVEVLNSVAARVKAAASSQWSEK